MSRSYPSRGGTVTFLNEGFVAGLLAGGLNVLMWLSYIVMLSLYSEAFGSYAASLVTAEMHDVAKHGFLSGAILLITVLNLASASTVARAERYGDGLILDDHDDLRRKFAAVTHHDAHDDPGQKPRHSRVVDEHEHGWRPCRLIRRFKILPYAHR